MIANTRVLIDAMGHTQVAGDKHVSAALNQYSKWMNPTGQPG